MAVSTHPAVVAVFPTRGQAEGAIDELWHAGFRHDQVGVITPGGVQEATTHTDGAEATAAGGAATGAVAGGAIGAIIGAAAVGAIPGIGPILAGGLLAGVATGAAA